jgi:hypothetical protein
MFCKQSQAAEISYFVESIENQGNENNGTHTISANAPASSPPDYQCRFQKIKELIFRIAL